MKISFVIPAYNEENYLGRSLEALFREIKTVENCDIEVIVVDNASTDKTGEVAQSFPGVILVRENRKGITFARQAGLQVSTGDIIANIDSDSVLTPGWIQTVIQEFTKNPKLIGLSGPFIYYDLSIFVNIFIRLYYVFGYITYLVNRHIINVSSMLQGGNFVVRRSGFDAIGGHNLSLTFYGEDTDLARRLHKVGPVKFTFRLPMYSSGRRLKAEGLLHMAAKYSLNHFWTISFKKSFNESYQDFRFVLPQDVVITDMSKFDWYWRLTKGVIAAFLLMSVGVTYYVVQAQGGMYQISSTMYEQTKKFAQEIWYR